MSRNRLHKQSAVRLLKCDAGHRVVGHEGKCKDLHGHEYFFEVQATADDLDDIGRVIDFSVIKEVVGGWIDEHWDHGMIIWEKDELAYLWTDEPTGYWDADDGGDVVYGPLRHQKHFFLPDNPTAENLASYLLSKAQELLKDKGIRVERVICHETSNCYAIADAYVG